MTSTDNKVLGNFKVGDKFLYNGEISTLAYSCDRGIFILVDKDGYPKQPLYSPILGASTITQDVYTYTYILTETSPPKVYYKVVTNGLKSNNHCVGSIQYILNEYVYPKSGTYLFVFKDLESAKDYHDGSRDLSIYECECEGVEERPSFMNRIKFPNIEAYPPGTIFAYGVKLLKEVKAKTSEEGKIWYHIYKSGRVYEFIDNGMSQHCNGEGYGRKVYTQDGDVLLDGYGNKNKKINMWYNDYYVTDDKVLADAISLVITKGAINNG